MQERMAYYQQDTLDMNDLLQQPDSVGSNALEVNPQTLLQPIPQRETSTNENVQEQKTSTATTASVPANSQQRYRWWQQEKNLTVGNSRYIEPKNEINFSTSVQKDVTGLALPNRPVNAQSNDWLTILLLGALVLFASIRTAYSKYLTSLFQSIFNYSTSLRMYQEKNYSFMHAAFRLEIYFYFVFSVFLFQIFRFFNVNTPYQNIGLFLFSLGLVLVYFIGKKMVYRVAGTVVEGHEETSEYLFNMNNVNRVTGLALFPVIALITFYPFENTLVPVITGIVLVGFFYFLLLFRGFTILLRKQFSIFYLFLYFCTLEILPLVLLFRIVAI